MAVERAREIQSTLGTTSESGQATNTELGEATELLGRAREELHTIVGSVQSLSGRNQQIGEIIESVTGSSQTMREGDLTVDWSAHPNLAVRIGAPRRLLDQRSI